MRLKVWNRPMRTVVAVSCVSGLVTGLVAAGGVAPAVAEEQPWTMPVMQFAAVPTAQAGEVVVWGDDAWGQLSVPAAVRGVAISQVVASSGAVLALTASGKVLGWGSTKNFLEVPPASLSGKRVTQIAISPGDRYAGAVTQDGSVVAWGQATTDANPIHVSADATNVTQLALSNENAIALRADHTVVAWGEREEINHVPVGLSAQAVVANDTAAYALTTAGTVVAWGLNSSFQLNLPDEVKTPGNVVAISAAANGGIAQLADGTFVGWGITYRSAGGAPKISVLPAGLVGQTITAFDASGADTSSLFLDASGGLHSAFVNLPDPAAETDEVPAALEGAPIVQFSRRSAKNGVALVTKVLPVAAPVVSGTPRAGSSLTGTGSAFSGSPDSVASQWYVNGVATGNSAPTLPLSAGLVGKTVTYVSTATKGGATVGTSTSTPFKIAAAPAPVKVASVTRVSSVKAAKKGVKVTIAGKVTASKAPTGTAVVVIAKGKKKVVTKTLRVPANGKISLTVTKFNKLALKAIKGKSKTRYRGKYTLTVSYAGNAAVKPSRTQKTFTVK